MKIIADKRIPAEARTALAEYGKVIEFQSDGITYDTVSGHPDVFMCQLEKELIIAPNTSSGLKTRLIENQIRFVEGNNRVGKNYPQTAIYNAVVTDKLLIHNIQHTDTVLLNKCNSLEKIDVKQGYSRCNLLALPNKRFITSDRGIESVLKNKGFDVLYVKPTGILLPGFSNGFIGGCCGVFEDNVFFIGSLKFFPEGEKIRDFLKEFKLIELYNGPLFDGGSLIFV